MTALVRNRDTVCKRAFRILGVYQSDETPGDTEMADMVEALDGLTKELQAEGLHVWTEIEGFLLPVAGQSTYLMGAGSYDVYGTFTNVVLPVAVGATSILVVSTASIEIGDQVGFQSGAVIFWQTVAAVGTQSVTTARGVQAPIIAGQELFLRSTASGIRPLRILSMRRSGVLSGIDIPIVRLARLDYQRLPNKQQSGAINSWFYDPQLGMGALKVWQPPMAPVQDILRFTFMRELSTWIASSAVGDFPDEWIAFLAYAVAEEVAPEYDIPPARLQIVSAKAAAKKMVVAGFDREPESVVFGVADEAGYD